jgi:class 3 adenylate cyclase
MDSTHVAPHHGRIVKTTDDGMLVEFASAVDTVSCAITVQKSMTDRNDANATNVNGNPRMSPAASVISTSQDRSAVARPDTG